MAMTYTESAALMNDVDFRGRVQVACLKYATYISDEAVSVPAHNTRFRWAQRCIAQPQVVAMEVQPPTVMDAAVQDAGKNVEDGPLQSAVENTINKLL